MPFPYDDPLYVLAVLGLLLALAEVAVRRTPLRHLGGALLVILLAALAVNLGVLPPAGRPDSPPVYGALSGPVAQVAIFWLLLGVSLGELRRAGGAMVGLFLLGSLGTFLGVLAGMSLVGGSAFGEHGPGLGAMFVGTYTGGSLNFNFLALEYGVQTEGALYLSAAAVDNTMTTVWMAVSLGIPRLLGRGRARALAAPLSGEQDDTEAVHPMDIGWLLALGCAAVWGSEPLAAWLSRLLGTRVLPVLVLTSLALVAAQVPAIRGLPGRRVLGMTAVYLFLAGIGALCDVGVLAQAGQVVGRLFLLATVTLVVHGVFVCGAGRLLGQEPEVIAVASQAGVGGSTTALAVARSLGRADLVLPGILVGALGTALGNYLGVLAAYLLA
jgi:uncharacterized membrane protein